MLVECPTAVIVVEGVEDGGEATPQTKLNLIGHESYAAGRYLYTPAPAADGTVEVDFNRAYNPPCVFTDYATCPLPPPENRLDLAVTAGEKKYVRPGPAT